MTFLTVAVLLIIALWAVSSLLFTGEDLSPYDLTTDAGAAESFPGENGPSAGHWDAVKVIESYGAQAQGLSRKERLISMREFMDELGQMRSYDSEFTPVDAGGIPAEWVTAPGFDSSRRVLYIHGGAFIAGSPLSHRNLTDCYARLTGAAVLAIDYRLMPEHRRRDGIADCETAYRWILENGPVGAEAVSHLVVSGDSAGGNLSLYLAAWARDQGLRPADAIVALSPTVDGTFSSPSIVNNLKTDVMLGPLFSILLKIPAWIRRWFFVLQNRFNPSDPAVSPVFGDLSGLPPTLIQVSEAEMLLDDAKRYVNKARAGGTPALMQSWENMLHVWHIFYPSVSEAGEAWDEIVGFLDRHSTRTPAAGAYVRCAKLAPGGFRVQTFFAVVVQHLAPYVLDQVRIGRQKRLQRLAAAAQQSLVHDPDDTLGKGVVKFTGGAKAFGIGLNPLRGFGDGLIQRKFREIQPGQT
jgi:acetyl esterase/lipase